MKKVLIIIVFLLVCFSSARECSAALPQATFAYLDVGQGNAEIMKVGNRSVLIDTGYAGKYAQLTSQLSKLGINHIHTLVVTHPHADHMESADKIIQRYKVKRIIMPKITTTSQCYARMIRAIKRYKVKKIVPTVGKIIKFAQNLSGKVLAVDTSTTDLNEASIVMRVTYGERSFLYMGDATARVENNIIESGEEIGSDVFLLAHHGADTSNGILFQKKALTSEYGIAVISVGEGNSYGHPDKFVLRRAMRFSKDLYRTDQDGMILVKTDGDKLEVNTLKIT